MTKQFVGFLAITIVVACGPSKQAITPPPVVLPVTTLPSLPESQINVPVKIVMPQLLAKAAQLIPKEVTSEGWPGYFKTGCEFQYKYRFVPGNFTFNCVSNQVQVKLNGTYQVAGERAICAMGKQTTPWVGGSCGFGNEPMRKTEIYINSQLSFQSNYTVRSYTTTQKVTATEKCTVTMFNMDITQQVLDSIKSSTNVFCHSIDSLINGFDFSSTTKDLAERINKKIALSKYGYLKINPSAARMGKLNYNKDTLQAILGISCFPELQSDSTNNFTASFLPPLQNADVPAGVIVYNNARYDYIFISSLVNQLVKDSSFELEGNRITIKNILVKGAENNKVEISVDFTGDKKGTLYLVGTPQLDAVQQIISMPDLDYSLKSNDLMLRLGKTFFNKKIINTLRDKASIKINELVEKNRAVINAQLSKKIAEGVFSQGTLTDIKIRALLVGKDMIQAQTCTRANIGIIMTGLN
jgi:hypothetical protein